MKEDFIKRQNKRSDKIESLIEEFGSIENIPDKFKDNILKEAMKDLPKINAIHISILTKEITRVRKELAFVEIGWVLLSLAMLFHVIVK